MLPTTAGLLITWALAGGSGDLGGARPLTVDDLAGMDESALHAVYRGSGAGSMPQGRLKGTVIPIPGTKMADARRKAGKLVWQGKRIAPDGTSIKNRFFGLPGVPGRLGTGTSWVDSRPSIIIDYKETSWIYRKYRDEIREVSPGLFLGVMHDRTVSPPKVVMYFALEQR